ncbi:AsnC family protein [Saccharomonospora xinjiangensis]|uniref:HTH asnC-type domain-containing protein n=1 Tax=Saccharomonospora xinjiangensis XJ-54 TaxID=882086 RepID=I0V6D0_9PSEU|nr:AsnC family protein [Saccharomonospora xinjiangensis]EID55683.1 hypothetical protein SacxiDRAFT_3482 [Saccharomonospora xinjiangensis XJ-54]
MALTDPVDARLLAALAEVGKVAVHELAARVGMDPRDVAYRLVGLSAQGLPLLVGVESDPAGLRAALASAAAPYAQPLTTNPGGGSYHGHPSAGGPVQGTPSGAYAVHPASSGPHSAQGGGYPSHGTPSGPYSVQGTPSGAYQVQGTPSGAYSVQGTPSGSFPAAPPAQAGPPHQAAASQQSAQMPPPDPVMSVWGPPQTALWARGDQFPAANTRRQGRPGEVLETLGLEGEQLAVQLLEIQDPADYLFAAAGYSLQDGERAVVVHTEITNKSPVPFAALPDNYLELLTADGGVIAKAPVSLTSRPPHKIGVQPGETSGGHTVYVVGESVRVTAVRWSPRPEPDERSLTWSLDD